MLKTWLDASCLWCGSACSSEPRPHSHAQAQQRVYAAWTRSERDSLKLPHKCKARNPSVFCGGARRFSRYTMQSASRLLHEARARRQLNSSSRRESEILLPSLLWFDFIAARCCSCRSVARVFVSIVWRLLSFLAWHDRKDHADVCVVVCGLSRGQSFKVRKARLLAALFSKETPGCDKKTGLQSWTQICSRGAQKMRNKV